MSCASGATPNGKPRGRRSRRSTRATRPRGVDEPVIASAAKQCRGPHHVAPGLVRRYAPRNDGGRNLSMPPLTLERPDFMREEDIVLFEDSVGKFCEAHAPESRV